VILPETFLSVFNDRRSAPISIGVGSTTWTPTGSPSRTGGRASTPDAGVFVGDPVAVGGQPGDQLLAGGFVGAFLAEPLGDVLS
jgi:hypothetical protein